jgi:hypothetical protein
MHPSAATQSNLVAFVFMPRIQLWYKIIMGELIATSPLCNWELVPVGEKFAIISLDPSPHVRIAMTIHGADAPGVPIEATEWKEASNQLWTPVQRIPGSKLWVFLSPQGLALQPQTVDLKGAPILLAPYDRSDHTPNQLWAFPDP